MKHEDQGGNLPATEVRSPEDEGKGAQWRRLGIDEE